MKLRELQLKLKTLTHIKGLDAVRESGTDKVMLYDFHQNLVFNRPYAASTIWTKAKAMNDAIMCDECDRRMGLGKYAVDTEVIVNVMFDSGESAYL